MAITHTPSFTLGNYSVHACKCVSTCVVQSRARPQTGLLLRAKNCKLFGSAQSAKKWQRMNVYGFNYHYHRYHWYYYYHYHRYN